MFWIFITPWAQPWVTGVSRHLGRISKTVSDKTIFLSKYLYINKSWRTKMRLFYLLNLSTLKYCHEYPPPPLPWPPWTSPYPLFSLFSSFSIRFIQLEFQGELLGSCSPVFKQKRLGQTGGQTYGRTNRKNGIAVYNRGKSVMCWTWLYLIVIYTSTILFIMNPSTSTPDIST